MTRFMTLILLTLILSLTSPTPSSALGTFAMKSSASFWDQDVQDSVARGSLAFIGPTGGGVFTITGSGGVVNPISTNAFGVRVRATKDGQEWLCDLSFVSTTQINLRLPLLDQGNPPVSPSGQVTFYVQKDVSGTWVDDRSRSFNVANILPMGFVSGSNANSQLWRCTQVAPAPCTGAEFHKNLLDGQPNPRTINGHPAILVVYVTGIAHTPTSGASINWNGASSTGTCGVPSTNGAQCGSGLTSFPGQEQINYQIPSNAAAGTHVIRAIHGTSGGTGNDMNVVFQ